MFSRIKKGYSPREEIPLAGYAAATLIFNALLFSITRLSDRKARRRGSDVPDLHDIEDMILAGIAMHKVSRIITKDAVTSFIRAPFTRYEEPLGYGEVEEKPRRDGNLEVVSEILNCNYCMTAWVGLGAYWGLTSYPEPTRLLLRFFSSMALSDFLHVFYEESRTRSNVLTLQEKQLEGRAA